MKAKFATVLGALLGAIFGMVVFRALDAGLVGAADWVGLVLATLAGTVAGAVVVEHAIVPLKRRRHHGHRGGGRAIFLFHRHIEG